MTGSSAHRTIAKRYANTLFDVVGAQAQDADTIRDELMTLAKYFNESESFRDICMSPLLSATEKHKAMALVAQFLSLSDNAVRFLNILAAHHRLGLIAHISAAYSSIMRLHRGEVEAIVTTARAVSDARMKEIVDALSAAFGKPVVVEAKVDASIIGGMKMRIGSKEVDATVAGKLARAAQRFDSIISAA